MTKIDEIRKNAEMAVKFQSWGNAAEACRNHIPWLLEKLKIAEDALEKIAEDQGYIKSEEPYSCAIAREALSKIRGEG